MCGTDDKYDYEVDYKRWQFTKRGLVKEGIQLEGRSTDEDNRAFKVMRIKLGLIYGKNPSICDIPEFKARLQPEVVHMQNTVLIGG